MSRLTNSINSLAVWSKSREQSVNLFSRQAIPMAWDFPEVNPFAELPEILPLQRNRLEIRLPQLR